MPIHSIASFLEKANNDTNLPLSEIRLLVMFVLNKTRIELITQSDYVLSPSELKSITQLMMRRIQGEPIAYLLGEREFFGINLHVTPDVLIPRPDTELLVELALKFAPRNGDLLDLGTGSGAVAIAINHERCDLNVTATDISVPALEIAKQNAVQLECPIAFIQSDWYENLTNSQWDIIVSNPPYIPKNDPHLSQGDLRFEPQHALTDNADGLSAYYYIIDGATIHLKPNGWLLLEHGYAQAPQVRAILEQFGFKTVTSWRDLAGIERVSGGQMRG